MACPQLRLATRARCRHESRQATSCGIKPTLIRLSRTPRPRIASHSIDSAMDKVSSSFWPSSPCQSCRRLLRAPEEGGQASERPRRCSDRSSEAPGSLARVSKFRVPSVCGPPQLAAFRGRAVGSRRAHRDAAGAALHTGRAVGPAARPPPPPLNKPPPSVRMQEPADIYHAGDDAMEAPTRVSKASFATALSAAASLLPLLTPAWHGGECFLVRLPPRCPFSRCAAGVDGT